MNAMSAGHTRVQVHGQVVARGGTESRKRWLRAGVAVICAWVMLVGLMDAVAQAGDDDGEHFDVLIVGGTVIDGTGDEGFQADVGIQGDKIAAVGDLADASADQEIDAEGLIVAPGFVEIHSHGAAGALPQARSSLTQGVTSEIINPDGGGLLNIAHRLSSFLGDGSAINVGAYAPFNSIWSHVVGSDDRDATAEEIERMQGHTFSAMANGAWGVSSGLAYTPAAFADTEEVIEVVEAAGDWRTNYPSHIRNESDDVVESTAEAIQIGEEAGLVPVVTHMKVMGPDNWGTSEETVGLIDEANDRGTYAAADVYPYLRSQTGINATIPAWVRDGGREAMLERFEDPELRPQIIDEIEDLLLTRVAGPEGVWIRTLGQTLAEVTEEMELERHGEAVIEVATEHGNPSSIWDFGHQDDYERILGHPNTAIASDGGLATSATTHPRNYGTQPRVLARDVREEGLLELEEAVHKMTGLPATIIGMVDRGYLEPGMAADVTVFDADEITDHATFDDPRQFSTGVEHVLVNGELALTHGQLTGAHPGEALLREHNMISRPPTGSEAVAASAEGIIEPHERPEPDGETFVADFSEDAVGSLPEGWSTLWNEGDWTVQDEPRRLNLPGGTDGRQALVWDEVGELDGEDMEVHGRFRASGDSSYPFYLGTHMFEDDDGDENAYVFRAHSSNNHVQLNSYTGGSIGNIDTTVVPFPILEDEWYQVALQYEDGWLRAKMWPDSWDEPDEWQVEAHDVRFSSGPVGLMASNADMVMDWTYVSAATGGERAPRVDGGEPPVEDEVHDPVQVRFDVQAEDGETSGMLEVSGEGISSSFEATEFGKLQTAEDGWASVTGLGSLDGEDQDRAFMVIADPDDPLDEGNTNVTVRIDGYGEFTGRLADLPPRELESLEVTPAAAEVAVGETTELAATATYDDDTEVDVTDDAEWASADEDVATVDAGVVTGVAEGDSDVTASFEGESGLAAVAVTDEDDDDDNDEEDPEPGPEGLERISAEPGRVEVAIAASQHRFGDGEADAVVLARADEYPDALAGTTLAAEHGAPLLLTSSDQLLDNVADEISRALGDDGAVYLTGGTAALDDTVEDAVDGLGYDSTRLGGQTRFETAGLIADELGDRSQVLVTTGLDFPDALTAGAAASANDGVVLLSAGDDAHNVVDGYLDGFDGDVTAVGGPATRAYPDAQPVMGETRDETAVAVAEAFFDEPAAFGISRRDDYPDALSGGAHIAAYGGPLLLSYTDDVPAETADWLQATDATGGFVYGGTAAIDEDTFDQIEDLAGFDNNDNDNDGGE